MESLCFACCAIRGFPSRQGYTRETGTDFYLILRIMEFGVASMDLQHSMYINLPLTRTCYDSSMYQLIHNHSGMYQVANDSAAYQFESQLNRKSPICCLSELLQPKFSACSTSEPQILLSIVNEARRRVYDANNHCGVLTSMSVGYCPLCGLYGCTCQKTRKRLIRSDLGLSQNKNPQTVLLLHSQIDYVSGLLTTQLNKMVTQANWACQCKTPSIKSDFSSHSSCMVPCFVCLSVVNLLSHPYMNVYRKPQETHRVTQALESRQFKVLTNLMDLNDGFF